MSLRNKILGVVLGMFVMGIVPQGARGTDIPIFPTGPVFRLTGLVWGTSTQPGFNNNYFFTPLAINESVCVYVQNNNPTNPHTFTASILVTSNPSNTTPSDGTWQNAAVGNNLNALTSPGLPGGIAALVSGASQVSINFSASSTLGGAPDTANVTITQTNGTCFAGNNMISSGIYTVAAAAPIQAVSESLSTSYGATSTVINPNGEAFHLNANNGVRSVYLDRAIISCSAACSVQMNTRANAGATCTPLTAVNLKVAFVGSVATTALPENACGTPPSGGAVFSTYDLAANTPLLVDLRGLLLVANTTQGFEIGTATALTGTMRVTVFWYEK
jgi:hypothetical protein